jgi:thymidylate synthase (FAD)
MSAALFPLLDDIGSIQLLETFGNDLTVVNAARVSFAKEVTEMKGGDEKLVKYLADHGHISPFFHPQVRLRLKMPIFVAREWYRHTIGFARNEVSRRYVDTVPECYVPDKDELRERDSNKKQGSKETPTPEAEAAHECLLAATKASMDCYKNLLSLNVAPEVARMILPQSMYTEFIETGSLYAYARLCLLRLDPQAQKEIREYATCLNVVLAHAFPVSWKALMGKFENGVAAPSGTH